MGQRLARHTDVRAPGLHPLTGRGENWSRFLLSCSFRGPARGERGQGNPGKAEIGPRRWSFGALDGRPQRFGGHWLSDPALQALAVTPAGTERGPDPLGPSPVHGPFSFSWVGEEASQPHFLPLLVSEPAPPAGCSRGPGLPGAARGRSSSSTLPIHGMVNSRHLQRLFGNSDWALVWRAAVGSGATLPGGRSPPSCRVLGPSPEASVPLLEGRVRPAISTPCTFFCCGKEAPPARGREMRTPSYCEACARRGELRGCLWLSLSSPGGGFPGGWRAGKLGPSLQGSRPFENQPGRHLPCQLCVVLLAQPWARPGLSPAAGHLPARLPAQGAGRTRRT